MIVLNLMGIIDGINRIFEIESSEIFDFSSIEIWRNGVKVRPSNDYSYSFNHPLITFDIPIDIGETIHATVQELPKQEFVEQVKILANNRIIHIPDSLELLLFSNIYTYDEYAYEYYQHNSLILRNIAPKQYQITDTAVSSYFVDAIVKCELQQVKYQFDNLIDDFKITIAKDDIVNYSDYSNRIKKESGLKINRTTRSFESTDFDFISNAETFEFTTISNIKFLHFMNEFIKEFTKNATVQVNQNSVIITSPSVYLILLEKIA